MESSQIYFSPLDPLFFKIDGIFHPPCIANTELLVSSPGTQKSQRMVAVAGLLQYFPVHGSIDCLSGQCHCLSAGNSTTCNRVSEKESGGPEEKQKLTESKEAGSTEMTANSNKKLNPNPDYYCGSSKKRDRELYSLQCSTVVQYIYTHTHTHTHIY